MSQSNKLTSLEKKWVLYDVGNSAWVLFASTILPIYFSSLVQGQDGVATTLWGYASSIVALIALFICPIFGTLADFSGKRKFFFGFALLGICGCAILSLPILTPIIFLIFYILTEVGLSSSCVFYDSMLTDVTTDDRVHNVSANGYAWGYIGSCIPFLVCLLLVLVVPNEVIAMKWRMIAAFIITAAWWLCFTLPIFKSYEQKHYLPKPAHPVKETFSRLGQIFKEIKQNKKAFLFLLAFFLYINGTSTIIKMATVYGEDMLHFETTQLLLALLLTQIVAFPSAILMGKLSKKFEDKWLILVCISGYVAVSLFALFLKFEWQFWLLAVVVGMFQGGIQAMSRSYFTRIIPSEKSGEYFGIYDIFAKGAATLGPALVSTFTLIFSNVPTTVSAVMNLELIPIPLLTIAGLVMFIIAAKHPTFQKEETIAEEPATENAQSEE
ncbi:MAG: MFS transporter [Clostridia bacterium]|nr:MFS transporter [Clostridia bacterium]